MNTQYSKIPGVRFVPSNLPVSIRDLLPLAERWCFTSDDELGYAVKSSTRKSLEEFVKAFEAKQDELSSFCFDTDHGVPIPDEAAVMQIAYRNFLEARSELPLRYPETN